MSKVLAFGTEMAAVDWIGVWIGVAVVLGIFALPVGYLLRGEARRSELRTGSRWVAMFAPAGFLAVVLVGVAREALGRTAAIAVFVGLCAVLCAAAVVRTRRESCNAAPPPPPPPIDALPANYRFHDGGGSLAGWGIPLAIIFVGAIAVDGQLAAGITLGLAVLAAAIGLTVVFGRRRRRQREIIADVERRAAGLPRDELRKLVELLELEHGRFEMRRLRRLVA